jgi:replicative DNA helicase Mcm
MSPSNPETALVDKCTAFLNRYCREELGDFAQSYPREQTSLLLSVCDVRAFDPTLADDLVERPQQTRRHFEQALTEITLPVTLNLSDASVRMGDLPSSRQYHIDELRDQSVGELIALTGQVSNRTTVRVAPQTAAFNCQRCGTVSRIPQDTTDPDLQEPHECQGCERQGPFVFDEERSTLRNVQVARLQLPPERSTGTATSVDVFLNGDAVDQLDGGDRVTITGRHTLDDDQGVGFGHRLVGDSVRVEETTFSAVDVAEHRDEIDALAAGEYGDPYELLQESIAPSVVGMETIKQVLALQLFGGSRVEHPDGTSTRGDIHILLVGDPGTAKSTLLEDIEDKAPSAVAASGKGATAAGLTASASQTEFGSGTAEWTLDAGALVLADDGIACIDELDKVDEAAVKSLHQALSKQYISVNKAGINTKLPTRTALLAAGNPKHGRFDEFESIAEQIDLPPTLLSRFDIIWPLNDVPDPDTDAEIASGMMHNHDEAIQYTAGVLEPEEMETAPAVPAELLRAWVAHAKQTCRPRWPEGPARESLVESFVALRRAGEGSDQPVPVTYRALESQRRLAEASARIRLSDTVEPVDVDRGRTVFLEAMQRVGVDPETGQLDADVIETGTSKAQREVIETLREIVTELAPEYDDGVPVEKVVERAEGMGIEPDKTEYRIEKLKHRGEVYTPAEGHLRLA